MSINVSTDVHATTDGRLQQRHHTTALICKGRVLGDRDALNGKGPQRQPQKR